MSCDWFFSVSLPNMMKNGDSAECWFGNQLYNAVAKGTTPSHSLCLVICLARQLLTVACMYNIWYDLWCCVQLVIEWRKQ